jgi:hypothetical protein
MDALASQSRKATPLALPHELKDTVLSLLITSRRVLGRSHLHLVLHPVRLLQSFMKQFHDGASARPACGSSSTTFAKPGSAPTGFLSPNTLKRTSGWRTTTIPRAGLPFLGWFSKYEAAVSYQDYNIGMVLAELAWLGLEESTVVALFGDHGWQLGEHDTWAKMTNFELATRSWWRSCTRRCSITSSFGLYEKLVGYSGWCALTHT